MHNYRKGMIKISIALRLNTIKKCDLIYVMEVDFKKYFHIVSYSTRLLHMRRRKYMVKKLQNSLTLSVFIILLLLTLPGYYLIVKEKKRV